MKPSINSGSAQQCDQYRAAGVSELSLHCSSGIPPMIPLQRGLLRAVDTVIATFFSTVSPLEVLERLLAVHGEKSRVRRKLGGGYKGHNGRTHSAVGCSWSTYCSINSFFFAAGCLLIVSCQCFDTEMGSAWCRFLLLRPRRDSDACTGLCLS